MKRAIFGKAERDEMIRNSGTNVRSLRIIPVGYGGFTKSISVQ